MIERLTLADLAVHGAHQEGHFRLSSGLHSSDYLQCALFLANPKRAARVGQLLTQAITTNMVRPDLIVAPALGGLIIGHETARALDVPFVFTERVDHAMTLRRGFAIDPEQGTVVVEDVVTTGGSIREVIEVVRSFAGRVLGVASIVNRSGSSNPFDPLPYQSLIAVDFDTWDPTTCPLCRSGVPIAKPGSRPVS